MKITQYALSEAVAARLREQNSVCSTITMGIRATGLSIAEEAPQLSMFPEDNHALRRAELERAMDKIRRK